MSARGRTVSHWAGDHGKADDSSRQVHERNIPASSGSHLGIFFADELVDHPAELPKAGVKAGCDHRAVRSSEFDFVLRLDNLAVLIECLACTFPELIHPLIVKDVRHED